MINYEIMSINTKLMSMQIRYTMEGKPDHVIRIAFPEPYTEESLHAIAVKQALQAEAFWAREEKVVEFALREVKGTTKRTVVIPAEDFNPAVEKLEEVVVEEEDRVVVTWIKIPLTEDELAMAIRNKRAALLAATDLLVMPDRPHSAEMLTYREALRDLPQQPGFPTDITWPIRPTD